MAHFSQIDSNNKVVFVLRVSNDQITVDGIEDENLGIEFCKSIVGLDTNWKKTSFNGNFRKQFGAVGFTYDEENDVFIAPKPVEDWILDLNTFDWIPPIPKPNCDDEHWAHWNFENKNWEILEKVEDSVIEYQEDPLTDHF